MGGRTKTAEDENEKKIRKHGVNQIGKKYNYRGKDRLGKSNCVEPLGALTCNLEKGKFYEIN